MAQIGTMHHFAIFISDMQRSEKFYASILENLGYAQGQRTKDESIPGHMPDVEDSFIIWTGSGGAISICSANPNLPNKSHDMYSPGLHHIAMAADSREQVDDFAEHLKKIGAGVFLGNPFCSLLNPVVTSQ